MNAPVRFGIRSQLVAFAMGLVSIVVFLQLMFFPTRQRQAAISALEIKATAVSELVANTVGASLKLGVVGEADRKLFEKARQDEDLRFMAVYDADNNLFIGEDLVQRPAWTSETALWEQSELGLLGAQTPVKVRIKDTDEIVGHLIVGYDTAAISRENRDNLLGAVGMGFVMMLVGGVLALVFGSWVGGRLQRITDLSGQVAAGRLDLAPLGETADDEIGTTARNLDSMLDTLRIVEKHVGDAAKGDLTQDIQAQGDLADALNRMFANQRELVTRIAETGNSIIDLGGEILSASKDQESGANEQASVVEETLRTMETLLNSANRIAETSQQVQEDAEQTHSNNRMINERITQLAGHTDRIGEFLEVIRDIANKTELLALNAALEGTRAGEAGRGFSLVATQMQRLTESVMEAVRDIKQLTSDIREATTASVLATEEGTKRASNTAQSARQISLIIQQQRSGTEQVTVSMDEISRVIRHSVASSAQGAEAAGQLSSLSRKLETLVSRFRYRGGGGTQ